MTLSLYKRFRKILTTAPAPAVVQDYKLPDSLHIEAGLCPLLLNTGLPAQIRERLCITGMNAGIIQSHNAESAQWIEVLWYILDSLREIIRQLISQQQDVTLIGKKF